MISTYPVQGIESYAFNNNTTLQNITFSQYIEYVGNYAFKNCTALADIGLNDSIMQLGNGSFYGCSSLISIDLPSGLEEIGYSAFEGSGLESITIPDSLQHIGNSAFDSCELLSSVQLGSGLKTIGDHAFERTAISTIDLPEGLEQIGGSTFKYCSNLGSLTYPSSIAVIDGDLSYLNCDALKQIVFLNTINDETVFPTNQAYFTGADNLEYLKLPEGLTATPSLMCIGLEKLNTVILPSSLASIGTRSFKDCSSLISIDLPTGLDEIGDYAFHGSGVENIAIPVGSGLKTIGDRAFQGTAISHIDLPEGLEQIGGSTFRDCSNLESVTYPSSIAVIDGDLSYVDCVELKQIVFLNTINDETVFPTNQSYFSFAENLEYLKLPEGLTTTPSHMCSGLKKLNTVILPSSLVSIGRNSFSGCSSLKSVDLPSGLKEIGDCAFQRTAISNIDLPEGLEQIGGETFTGCNNLSTIEYPDTITTINGRLLYFGCDNLKYVKFRGDAPHVTDAVFYSDSHKTIHYNADSNGFTTPKWMGHPCYPSSNSSIAELQYNKNEISLTVTDSAGNHLEDAIVDWDGNTYYTDSKGMVALELMNSRRQDDMCIVTREGYREQKLNIGSAYSNYAVLSANDEPVKTLKMASVDSYGCTTDILHERANIHRTSLNMDDKITIRCEADDEIKDSVSEYRLCSSDSIVKVSDDGNFEHVPLSSFEENKDIHIDVVIGNEIDRTDLKLEIIDKNIPEGLELIWGEEGFSITINDDVELIGGTTMNVQLPTLPLDVTVENNKYCLSYNLNDKSNKSMAEQWKEIKDKVDKDMDISDLLKKTGTGTFKSNLDASIDVVLYGEIDFNNKDENDNVVVKLDIIVCIKGEGNATAQYLVGVVPVAVNFSGELSATVTQEVKYELKTQKSSGEFLLNLAAKISVFCGVSLGTSLGVGAYGAASLESMIVLLSQKDNPGIKEVKLSGEVGLKAYLLFAEIEKTLLSGSKQIYPSKSSTMRSAKEGMNPLVFTADDVEVMDLNYLASESKWLGNTKNIQMRKSGGNQAYINFTELYKDTYRNARPKLASYDDKLVLAFIRAEQNQISQNSPYAVYSFFDGNSWSEPIAIDNNGTMDNNPSIISDTNTLYYLFQDTAEVLGTNTELVEAAKMQNIVISEYEGGKFHKPVQLSDDSDEYYHDPVGTIQSDKVYVAWRSNTVTDLDSLYSASGENGIYFVQRNSSWSNPVKLVSEEKPIVDMKIGTVGDEIKVCYIVDGDGDLNTEDDRTVKVVGLDGGIKVLFEGKTSRVEMANLTAGDADEVVFNAPGKIIYSSDCNEVKEIAIPNITAEYSVLKNNLFFSSDTGDEANMFLVKYYNGDWTEPILLTNDTRYFENISAAEIGEEIYFTGMHTAVTMTEDKVEDKKNLVYAKLRPVTNINIEQVECQEVLEYENQIPMKIRLKNLGSEPVEAVNLMLEHKNAVLFNGIQSVIIDIGEEVELSTTMPRSEQIDFTDYKLSIVNSSRSNSLENNSQYSFSLGKCDLSVSTNVIEIGERQNLEVTVLNEGNIVTDGLLMVYPPESTDAIFYEEINDLGPGQRILKLFEVNDQMMNNLSLGFVNVEVITNDKEINTFDNKSKMKIERLENDEEGLLPPNFTIRQHNGTAVVEWEPVEGARGYQIYRSETEDEGYQHIKTTTLTAYTDTNLEMGKTYYYKMRSYSKVDTNYSFSDFTDAKAFTLTPPSVGVPTASLSKSGNAIKVSWTQAANATGYQVYRADKASGPFKKFKTTGGLVYTNAGALVPGMPYFYKVRAYRKDGGSYTFGDFSEVKGYYAPGELETPDQPNLTLDENAGGIRLNWDEQDRITGYQIYRGTSTDKDFGYLKTASGSAQAYTNLSGLTTGRPYYYKVRAYRMAKGVREYGEFSEIKGLFAGTDEAALDAVDFSLEDNPNVTAPNVRVRWSKVNGADGYCVYRWDGVRKRWIGLKKTGPNARVYTNINGVVAGKTHYYAMRPYHISGGVTYYGNVGQSKGFKVQ